MGQRSAPPLVLSTQVFYFCKILFALKCSSRPWLVSCILFSARVDMSLARDTQATWTLLCITVEVRPLILQVLCICSEPSAIRARQLVINYAQDSSSSSLWKSQERCSYKHFLLVSPSLPCHIHPQISSSWGFMWYLLAFEKWSLLVTRSLPLLRETWSKNW